MNSSSDAAETVVRMGLQGTEYALKITGTATKQLAAIILAILKDKKQTKGKVSLTKMLKTGKPLNVFSVKKEDLKTFQREAKRYGILYTALIDKRNNSLDGMVDILVREEDAPKINRIVDRFKLSTFDKDKIMKEVESSNNKEKVNMSPEDKLIEEIIAPAKAKVEIEVENEDPSLAKIEKSPLSEQNLVNENISEKGTNSNKKPSVSKELKNIKEEMAQNELGKTDSNNKSINKEKGNKIKKSNTKKQNKKSVKRTKKKVKGR